MSLKTLQRANGLVPFSHQNGVRTILPGRPFFLEIFHTALRLYRFGEEKPQVEVLFNELGLVDGWTVFFDAVHHKVVIEGRSFEGFFRYEVVENEEGIFLRSRKKGSLIFLAGSEGVYRKELSPRLILGCNKAPSIERMRQHLCMNEILPHLYQMGRARKIPLENDTLLGKITLAGCEEAMKLLKTFWNIALDDNCVPKRIDNKFFGYREALVPLDLPLSDVLDILSHKIRSFFIQEKEGNLLLLPALPKEFLSGRLLGEKLINGHKISFEWRRGKVRRVLFEAEQDDEISLLTDAEACSIRSLTKGSRKRNLHLQERIAIKAKDRYLLDNFA